MKLTLLALPLLLLTALPSAAATTTMCTLKDTRITESSGLAVNGPVLWTHNDSGDSARFFALDRRCATQATYNVAGAGATDWEDMARGAGALWFGDIGDNAATRSEVQVVKVTEPKVRPGTHTVRGTVLRFRYEDGAHDAETLLVHPKTGQLFVVTKTYYGVVGIYAAPVRPAVATVNVLTKVGMAVLTPSGGDGGALGTAGQLATTAGSINASATRVVVRTYSDAFEWTISGGDVAQAFNGTPRRVSLPTTTQGEAIAYDTDGKSWLTTSEGTAAPVHRVGA